jgi:hypothetical protein
MVDFKVDVRWHIGAETHTNFMCHVWFLVAFCAFVIVIM